MDKVEHVTAAFGDGEKREEEDGSEYFEAFLVLLTGGFTHYYGYREKWEEEKWTMSLERGDRKTLGIQYVGDVEEKQTKIAAGYRTDGYWTYNDDIEQWEDGESKYDGDGDNWLLVNTAGDTNYEIKNKTWKDYVSFTWVFSSHDSF